MTSADRPTDQPDPRPEADRAAEARDGGGADDRERGRPVHLVIGRAFAEAVGPEAVQAYVGTLVAVAADAAGRGVDDVRSDIVRRAAAAGVDVDTPEATTIAERLADPAAGPLIVSTDDGTRLHGEGDIDGGRRSARQEEPSDPERPLYS